MSGKDAISSVVITGALLVAIPALALAQTVGAAGAGVPRTPWGSPDLQGIWNNSTMTPLERLTEEEQALDAAALVSRQRIEAGHPGVREPAVPFAPIP